MSNTSFIDAASFLEAEADNIHAAGGDTTTVDILYAVANTVRRMR